MNNKVKLYIEYGLAAIGLLSGIVLLYIGCFMPPKGQIDASLLTAFGEVATFCGTVFGIDSSYRKRELDSKKNA